MLFASLSFAVAVAATPPTAGCAANLESARAAYGLYQVAKAERLYQAVAKDGCSAAETAEASVELARIAWLVDGATEAAVHRLNAALPRDPEPCNGARLLGRILNAAGRNRETPAALAPYTTRCASLDPGVTLEVAEARILDAAAAAPATRRKAARGAAEAWRATPELGKASLQGARQQLAIGLLAGDSEAALTGWSRFYWLDDGVKPQAFSESDAAVRRIFARGLRPGAADVDRAALAQLLVRGGFADEAERLASGRGPGADTANWRGIDAYLRLRRDLRTLLLAHDRAYARGRREEEDLLEPAILKALGAAVAEAGRPGEEPWAAARELWGLFGTTGTTNGVSSLHLGHVSVDTREAVVQGARRGSVGFITLDNMIANAFSGWIGDGQFAPGGWAADNRIIQIRSRYVQTALDAAAVAAPGPARNAYVARMREREATDIAIAQATPIAFLPGLADRLRLQAIDQIADEVRAAGQGDFARRFSKLWYDRTFEGAILKHEGRHVLDQASYQGSAELSDSELEYRAKLSELSMTTSPRVLLTSIYGRVIGGETGHGVANARLLGDYLRWMEAHPSEVRGLDATAPTLTQLDRLTDEQIRAIAAGLDPEPRAGG